MGISKRKIPNADERAQKSSQFQNNRKNGDDEEKSPLLDEEPEENLKKNRVREKLKEIFFVE